jgi:hypothetical protein
LEPLGFGQRTSRVAVGEVQLHCLVVLVVLGGEQF